MKKIYSFMLLAAAMLLSISVNAVNVAKIGDATYESLTAAFEAAQESSAEAVTIELVATEAITLDASIVINTTKSITLDMAGRTITASGISKLFQLQKGELIVTSATPAVIQNSGEVYGFYVTGTYKNPGNDGKYETGKNYYSHLSIGENITVKVTNIPAGGKARGIGIDQTTKVFPTYKYNNKDKGTVWHPYSIGHGLANGVKVDVEGDIELTGDATALGYGVQVSGNVRYVAEFLDIDKYATIYTDGTATHTAAGYIKSGFGAVEHENKVCYQFTVGEDVYYADAEWANYAPHINLGSNCEVSVPGTSANLAAIYAAGYAIWNISCTADGATALFAKSGQITVTNATLHSNAEQYQTTGSSGRSGVNSQGSAVVIESNAAYSGAVEITIEGDTKIKADYGCAIEEVVTTSENTHVSALDIQGGTFQSGSDPNAGCIKISEVTLAANADDDQVTTITVGGGSYTAQTMEQQTAAQTLLETLLGNQTPSNPNYTIEVNNGGASQTGTSIVINPTVIPDPITTVFTFSDLKDAASAGQDVNLAEAQVDGGQLVIAEDIELQNLYMNSNSALSIIIPDGITMTAKRIVMGDNDNITVKAGGRLIIDGDQGLYNTKVENLLIEAEEDNMGLFIWKPTVATNRHPYATVELMSKAYKDGSKQVWQRFGVPTYNGIARASIIRNIPTAFMYWDNEYQGVGGWRNVPENVDMMPFVGYSLSINSNNPGAKYTFECDELYGNVNAEMNFEASGKWNYLSNSYTGEIDLHDLLLRWLEVGKCEAGVHFHISSEDNSWSSFSLNDYSDYLDGYGDIEEIPFSKIAPMQCFVTRTKVAEGIEAFKETLDYEALVWNHKDDANVHIGGPQSAPAPARRNMAQVSDYTKAIVVIANGETEQRVTLRQGSQFSEEFDNGAEMSCFKNGNINLFATTEYGDMAQVATDNLIGQTLSVESAKAASFKMTFKSLFGEQLAIRDNMTGSVINMTEGEEYFFSVAPGTTADRFEIVEAAKMPTDVEMLEAAPAKKGIYTLVGQYLGENFDVLPAGIYVVNGKKVVK